MSNEAVQHLQTQVKELSTHLEGLEKERDFYFEKVRNHVPLMFGILLNEDTYSFVISRFLYSSRLRSLRVNRRMIRPFVTFKRFCIPQR